MVTLHVIPEAARVAMEDGKHVLLTSPEGYEIVVAFEGDAEDRYEVCDWETEDGWKHDE